MVKCGLNRGREQGIYKSLTNYKEGILTQLVVGDGLTLNTCCGLVTRLNALPALVSCNPHCNSIGVLLFFLCFTNGEAEAHISKTTPPVTHLVVDGEGTRTPANSRQGTHA